MPTPAELFSLKGRVALVTGASRGLGWAIARGLAQAGAHVALCGRDEPALIAHATTLRDGGATASTHAFDVTDEHATDAAVANVTDAQGRLDILVNCAGRPGRHAFESMPTADWRAVLDTNLDASFFLARAAAQPMLRQGYGRIINVVSVAAQIARPTIAAYVASKHALTGLTRALAVEYGGRGITANAIAPGYFVTDFTRPLVDNAEFDRWLKARTPVGRWGNPAELAGAAVFLASDAAAYVNGHILVVDGGMSAAM